MGKVHVGRWHKGNAKPLGTKQKLNSTGEFGTLYENITAIDNDDT
jgi:hypothetical protein